jgi:hypothetical protein
LHLVRVLEHLAREPLVVPDEGGHQRVIRGSSGEGHQRVIRGSQSEGHQRVIRGSSGAEAQR